MTSLNSYGKVRALCYTFLLAFTLGTVIGAEPPVEPNLEAAWVGTLNVGAIELKLVFDLKKKTDGSWDAQMDSPDQGAFGIKIDNVLQDKDAVVLEIRRLNSRFEGKFSDDQKKIEGQWKQVGKSFPLLLSHGSKLAALKRPQEPKQPFPYDEIEVSYENAVGKAKFVGTLTRPREPGRYPAVLLITGSGSQNRDEELFGHKPFLLLADDLTRRGLAVLRVDDRGVGGSTGDVTNATTEDFVTDVMAGIAFLRSRSDVDGDRIGLLGHSEGANIAVEIAAKSELVSFIVLLGTTTVPGDQLLFKQAELISRGSRATDAAIKQNRDLQEGLFSAVKTSSDRATAEANVDKFLGEWKRNLPPLTAISMSDATLKAEANKVMSPWFRRFLQHDPQHDLALVRCPILALFGERDLQVAPSQNRPPLEAALKTSGNRDHEIHVFPSLNHLFQTSTTGLPSEYATIEETISPDALAVIGDWIQKHTVKK
jgi:uncharacterized protein